MSVKPQAIVCENLGFQQGKSPLLTKVSARFEAAKINVILGQNGAGKSTLLKLLGKSFVPTSGQIVWHQQALAAIDLAELALQRAVVSQTQSLQFDFSVKQLVSLGLEVQFSANLQGAHNADFEQILTQILQVCELTALQERSILTLSGGEQKRAQIARALAQIWPLHKPMPSDDANLFAGRWLLLDEWNAALDIRHQQSFANSFQRWCRQGLGVIMVVHDVTLAAQIADRVLLLKDGTAFAEGEAQTVMQKSLLEAGLEMELLAVTGHNLKNNVFVPAICA